MICAINAGCHYQLGLPSSPSSTKHSAGHAPPSQAPGFDWGQAPLGKELNTGCDFIPGPASRMEAEKVTKSG